MQSATYFVRNKGRITGPFDRSQLESMFRRGMLSKFHEVSADRLSWSRVQDVLQADAGAVPSSVASTAPASASYNLIEEPAKTHDSPDPRDAYAWYYARDDTPIGPSTFSELKRSAAAGEIGPRTRIWNETMADWVEAATVDGFAFGHTRPYNAPARTQPSPDPGASSSQFTSPSSMTVAPVPADRPMSGFAIYGFIASLLGFIGFGLVFPLVVILGKSRLANDLQGLILFFALGLLGSTSLLGLVLSSVGMNKCTSRRGTHRGMGLSIAGLVLGILGMLSFASWIYLIVLGLALTAPNRFA